LARDTGVGHAASVTGDLVRLVATLGQDSALEDRQEISHVATSTTGWAT